MYSHIKTILLLLIIAAIVNTAAYSQESALKDWWQGGIGITFGNPAAIIPDITELGYEIKWGGGAYLRNKALKEKNLKYWNGIIEIYLKDKKRGYNFEHIKDKRKASKYAFNAWAKYEYREDNLAEYATVCHKPNGNYGDVSGSMDLSSPNPLVKAILKSFDNFFKKNKAYRGIAIDNALKIPASFLKQLHKVTKENNCVISVNTIPQNLSKEKLKYIDIIGGENFQYDYNRVRQLRAKGFNGYFFEFTKQHLNSRELESYLLGKVFNGVVFFGYMGPNPAVSNSYSSYKLRPDIFNHHRWIIRKNMPMINAILPYKELEKPSATMDITGIDPEEKNVAVESAAKIFGTKEGKIIEETKHGTQGIDRISGITKNVNSFIKQYGNDISGGIYFYVYSTQKCIFSLEASNLKFTNDMIVYDELKRRIKPFTIKDSNVSINIDEGVSIFQIGRKSTVAKNLHKRINYIFEQEDKQNLFEESSSEKIRPLWKWSKFIQGGEAFADFFAKSGQNSFYVKGGVSYKGANSQFKYFLRSGASQFVNINQSTPEPLIITAYSKCKNVKKAELKNLNILKNRRSHFNSREGYIYAIHVYLDYQDGNWPTVHSTSFSPGTHDWQKIEKTINPTKPVKTAMVLIEFFQPAGEAWFDDIVLTSINHPKRNLLANGNLEALSFIKKRIEQHDFNRLYKSLKERITVSSNLNALAINDAETSVYSLKKWIESDGRYPLFSREWRDLTDIQNHFILIRRILNFSFEAP